MRRHKLDLNLLLSLRELLIEKSVTKAGDNMCVTQSSMSGILARLRDYFGDPLIVAVGRRMELTELGASLVEPVNDLLVRIDATLSVRPGFDPVTSKRHFKIIASDYVATVLMLEVLRAVNAEANGVTIELQHPSEDASERLEAGEVDFIITPQQLSSGKHMSRVMFEDSYSIVVDREHPEIGDTITLEQYFRLRHAMFHQQGVALVENWFAEHHGDQRQIEVITHTFSLLPFAVAGTRLIATMHTRLAQRYLPVLPVKLVRPLFAIPTVIEVLQWHNHRDADLGNQWLRQKIIAAAQSLPPLA
ncbi:LysR family transcriptional regulator [Duganella sp. FT80W]|uniref:LysR family transcriptional regulator n=1 Tax=Duganella guangzhouensis TaxID=2666084 RepID=A0A6I2KU25_9BURK|nr:LysR family transcriptional regulator [Duganella guangzhouensis]MRW88557.1 LysR family transcriptional regulator [Duganella guangzhouensis]